MQRWSRRGGILRRVLTTDAQVEGVHFDRRFSSPEDIGFRSLAVNVSDIAAMGATARWALVSLVLPDATAVAEVDGIVEGIVQLAESAGNGGHRREPDAQPWAADDRHHRDW